MQLYCKSCGEPILAEDIHLERALAKCRACNAVFGFEEDLGIRSPEESPEPRGDTGLARRSPALAVPIPDRFRIEEGGRDLRITWRWFRPVAFGLLFFSLVWNGFLVGWYTIALEIWKEAGPMAIFFFVLPLIHVAVGIAMAYFTLALFLNRTSIEITSGILSVTHGPVPWRGVSEIASSDVEQIWIEAHLHSGRRRCSITYRVHALLRNGRGVQLLTLLDEKSQALFLEQKIEAALGIEDRRVPGETEK
jgi:hypothetical protein